MSPSLQVSQKKISENSDEEEQDFRPSSVAMPKEMKVNKMPELSKKNVAGSQLFGSSSVRIKKQPQKMAIKVSEFKVSPSEEQKKRESIFRNLPLRESGFSQAEDETVVEEELDRDTQEHPKVAIERLNINEHHKSTIKYNPSRKRKVLDQL